MCTVTETCCVNDEPVCCFEERKNWSKQHSMLAWPSSDKSDIVFTIIRPLWQLMLQILIVKALSIRVTPFVNVKNIVHLVEFDRIKLKKMKKMYTVNRVGDRVRVIFCGLVGDTKLTLNINMGSSELSLLSTSLALVSGTNNICSISKFYSIQFINVRHRSSRLCRLNVLTVSRAVNWSGQCDIYIDIETLFDIQNVEEKCEQVTHRNTWNLSGVQLL